MKPVKAAVLMEMDNGKIYQLALTKTKMEAYLTAIWEDNDGFLKFFSEPISTVILEDSNQEE